jgi:hypothetical protein
MTTSTEGKFGAAPCPICKTIPNPETGRCRCPPTPGRWIPTANLSSDTLVTQAESLFENYLAARLVRARRALTNAKVTMLRDPRNRAKLEALRAAEVETEKLQAQLLEQTRKVAAARERTAGSAPAPREEQASAESSEATPDFRMVQAAKADAVYQPEPANNERDELSRQDDRDCPQCGARLPGDIAVCACGYDFLAPGRSMVAEPFLTAEEVAALRGKPSKGQA